MSEKYPEHAKLRAVKNESQVIGEFLASLEERGMVLCDQLPEETDRDGDTWPGEIVPTQKNIELLLAEYFEIDLRKISAEKDAMLEELQRAQR